MNAEVRQIRTQAEQGLATAFAAARSKLPGKGGIADLRVDAFKRFEAVGLPHRRIEEWKYTDLRAAMRDAYPLAAPPDAAAKAKAERAGRWLGDVECRRIVFVDGALVRDLSDLAALESGLTVGSLAAALAAGEAAVTAHLGKVVPTDDLAVALNTAFMGDGAVIDVAPGATLERPLHLVFATAGERPAAVFIRSLVTVGKGARAMLIESHEGQAERDVQVNSALELKVEDEAHVDYVKVNGGAREGLHVSSLMGAVGAHARLNAFTFVSGGAMTRNQVFLRFDGEGTVAAVRGVHLLRGRQHADATLVINHLAPGCQSREVFKSALDGESRGVFQGRIVVAPGAQKTDARMMTQALLLSEDAEADNKPELEIFADDVQCGHGATTGALDQELLFYLKTRGIPQPEAEALLIQAFIGEAVDGIEHAGLREALMDAALAWLKERGG